MNNLNHLFVFIILFAMMQIGCNSIDQHYENPNKSCTLKLYKKSNYTYKFPNFISEAFERGTYTIQDTNLILTHKEKNHYPNSEISSTWMYENPDKLNIRFININREKINVEFEIKENTKRFLSISGETELFYADLEQSQLIPSGGQISNLKIYYNDEIYLIDSMYINQERRPTHLKVTLNEFKDKSYVFLHREYVMKNNRILMNDMNIKNIGTRNRYLLKKKIR